ncbi:hypothetical protein NE237_017856 [Protea cynaroides]|uniref:Late embryogenesis abundant protein LEA-2 subgroup domain-containing protein n=1 Tax=Protea cynaroides TaxID=273540 RepID=A0A9Q0K8U1_9MAGN|nr:hypothetical protein NE237_017856 [Protea cynaroides]
MTTRANVNGEHRARQPGPRPHQHQDQHYYPHNHYYSSSSAASFKGCCCCLFLLITFLGLLVLAVVLVIVLAVKPKKPQFDLQQVSVQYVGISTVPASPTSPATTASLSLTIRMVFTAANPNKVGIKYSESKFYVMYRGVPLGVATVPGFYQPSHSVRQVETTVVVDRINLLQTDAEDLVKDASLNDRVELKVMGDVGAKIRVLEFTSPRVQVTVNCIVVISPRKQTLTYKQCGVDGLNV